MVIVAVGDLTCFLLFFSFFFYFLWVMYFKQTEQSNKSLEKTHYSCLVPTNWIIKLLYNLSKKECNVAFVLHICTNVCFNLNHHVLTGVWHVLQGESCKLKLINLHDLEKLKMYLFNNELWRYITDAHITNLFPVTQLLNFILWKNNYCYCKNEILNLKLNVS